MILTLHTECVIDSCHKLEGYKGVCSRLHGHTWKIEVWFKGDSALKDKVGILVDFGIVKELSSVIDHRYINDEIGMNPTAENITEWCYDKLKKGLMDMSLGPVQVKVRVYETSIGKVTYCEGGDF